VSTAKPDHEQATKSIEELFKTLITTAGIILALLWELGKHDGSTATSSLIRWSSICLLISIFASILGCQFIITERMRGSLNIPKEASVAYSSLAAWIAFLAGMILLAFAIFFVR
jgi:hypothetical protein